MTGTYKLAWYLGTVYPVCCPLPAFVTSGFLTIAVALPPFPLYPGHHPKRMHGAFYSNPLKESPGGDGPKYYSHDVHMTLVCIYCTRLLLIVIGTTFLRCRALLNSERNIMALLAHSSD